MSVAEQLQPHVTNFTVDEDGETRVAFDDGSILTLQRVTRVEATAS